MFGTVLFNDFNSHMYSLAATGIKIKDEDFSTRQSAEKKMHKYMKKYNLHIVEVWDDHHFKTYKCNDGIKFYISRV